MILPSKYMAFPYLDQSRWEDKITATKIREVFDTNEFPPERVFASEHMMLISFFFCYHGDML